MSYQPLIDRQATPAAVRRRRRRTISVAWYTVAICIIAFAAFDMMTLP
jgi:hypothetical protein